MPGVNIICKFMTEKEQGTCGLQIPWFRLFVLMLVFGGLFVLFVSGFLVSLSLLGESQEDDAAAEKWFCTGLRGSYCLSSHLCYYQDAKATIKRKAVSHVHYCCSYDEKLESHWWEVIHLTTYEVLMVIIATSALIVSIINYVSKRK